jgi:hypothetical protein
MEFHDIGAVVHFLRKVIWLVPGFTVQAYEPRLRALHERMTADGPFVAHSTRHLLEARERSGGTRRYCDPERNLALSGAGRRTAVRARAGAAPLTVSTSLSQVAPATAPDRVGLDQCNSRAQSRVGGFAQWRGLRDAVPAARGGAVPPGRAVAGPQAASSGRSRPGRS